MPAHMDAICGYELLCSIQTLRGCGQILKRGWAKVNSGYSTTTHYKSPTDCLSFSQSGTFKGWVRR